MKIPVISRMAGLEKFENLGSLNEITIAQLDITEQLSSLICSLFKSGVNPTIVLGPTVDLTENKVICFNLSFQPYQAKKEE